MSNGNSKSFFTKVKELLVYPAMKRQEIEKQKREGYEVKIPSDSRGEYVVYREGPKSLWAYIDINQDGEITLYTQTLEAWDTPVKGKKLSQVECDLVVKRIFDYLSIEGKVILNNNPLITREEQLASMTAMVESEGWTVIEEGGQTKFINKNSKS
jgi:hypothetical protein